MSESVTVRLSGTLLWGAVATPPPTSPVLPVISQRDTVSEEPTFTGALKT
jgi:hypothetical protein